MIDKVQYTDFYRFFVSTGIVLIAAGVAYPYLFLNTDFGLLVEQKKFDEFSDTSEVFFKIKFDLVAKVFSWLPYIQFWVLVIGVCILAIGCFLWLKRQVNIDDRKAMAETKKVESEIPHQSMTTQESNKKAEEKVLQKNSGVENSMSGDQPYRPNRISVNEYIEVEQKIVEKFRNQFGHIFDVLPNQFVKGKGYDIILLAKKNDMSTHEDEKVLAFENPMFRKSYFVEIKFVNHLNTHFLRDRIKKIIEQSTSISDDQYLFPIVIIVAPEMAFENFKQTEFIKRLSLDANLRRVESKWRFLFIRKEKLDQFDFSEHLIL